MNTNSIPDWVSPESPGQLSQMSTRSFSIAPQHHRCVACSDSSGPSVQTMLSGPSVPGIVTSRSKQLFGIVACDHTTESQDRDSRRDDGPFHDSLTAPRGICTPDGSIQTRILVPTCVSCVTRADDPFASRIVSTTLHDEAIAPSGGADRSHGATPGRMTR